MSCGLIQRTNTADWERTIGKTKRHIAHERLFTARRYATAVYAVVACLSDRPTGINPAGDAGDTSPNILVGGRQREYPPILLRTFGRYHSAIRRQ